MSCESRGMVVGVFWGGNSVGNLVTWAVDALALRLAIEFGIIKGKLEA